ncbi:unnamed protein product [Scytosiphon promiscuus]
MRFMSFVLIGVRPSNLNLESCRFSVCRLHATRDVLRGTFLTCVGLLADRATVRFRALYVPGVTCLASSLLCECTFGVCGQLLSRTKYFSSRARDLRIFPLHLIRPAPKDDTVMSAPLPDFWSEEVDSKGRTYYSNHRTRETTWQRPAAPAAPELPDLPPAYGRTAYAPRQQIAAHQPAPRKAPSGPCCTPKLTFWVSCALGWIVWLLAVAATADDAWIILSGFGYAALDKELLDSCDSTADVCDLYKAFSAMQAIAVVSVSVSMLVQMVAFFRPASGRCCNVQALALAGGSLMVVFSFCQMLAFVLVIVIEKELDDGGFTNGEAKLGATFGVGVTAFLLGMLQAASVFTFARGAGNGPINKCCHQCMGTNRDPNRAGVNRGGSVNYQQPQPPQQHQRAPRTAVFGTGLPEPVPTRAGHPPEPASVPA